MSIETLIQALEADIEAHKNGEYMDIASRWDEVYSEILSKDNEIREDLLGLTLNFWDDWGDAANHEWQYHSPFEESDWPDIAQTIVVHLRNNTIPEDRLILEHFLPRPRKSIWERITRLLFGKT